jgi:hypothetical protein
MRWKVDNIAVVIFHPPGRPVDDALQLWQSLGLGTPDSFQRPQGQLAGASSLAQGVADKVRLTINAQFGRSEFMWMSGIAPSDEPPSLENWEAVADRAMKAVQKLLAGTEAIRVGVSIQTSCRLVEGAVITAEFEKLGLDATFPEGAEDLIYQFNTPRNFSDSAWRMNRIHT